MMSTVRDTVVDMGLWGLVVTLDGLVRVANSVLDVWHDLWVWRTGVWMIVFVAWIWIGHRYVAAWHDPITYWTRAVAVTPARARPLVNLAMAYEAVGRQTEASLTWMAVVHLVCEADRTRPQPFFSDPRPALQEGRSRCEP